MDKASQFLIKKFKRMKICFATNNRNKVEEINKLLGDKYEVLSLEDIGCQDELPETKDTLEGNSLQKARYVYEKFQVNCFADDTGLEVEALGGEPGVYSAMYAGPQRNNEDNIRLLLKNLEGKSNRRARFRTVISLIIDGKTEQLEGIVEGRIISEMKGEKGFGYDPVFVPDGYSVTFAQMSMDEKNKISHRGHAIRKLVKYLQEIEGR